jgi:glycosyltransferase involved in cell wall biosynthesis
MSEIRGKEIMEVILLHNEPKEDELAIIRQFLPEMNYIRHIIIPKREPLYSSWNRGIQLAEGEYITVWNVDDIRFPDSLLQQAEALDKHPEAAVCYGDIWTSDSYGKRGETRTHEPFYNYKKEFFKSYRMSCFQMWRKSIHQTVGFYDEQFKCSADFDFQIRVALHFPFVKTDELLGSYLEYQTHKISLNGLQELENNIIYLRYGVYNKINLLNLGLSKKKYRKNKLLYENRWLDFSEKCPFGTFSKIKNIGILCLKTLVLLLKKIVKKVMLENGRN